MLYGKDKYGNVYKLVTSTGFYNEFKIKQRSCFFGFTIWKTIFCLYCSGNNDFKKIKKYGTEFGIIWDEDE